MSEHFKLNIAFDALKIDKDDDYSDLDDTLSDTICCNDDDDNETDYFHTTESSSSSDEATDEETEKIERYKKIVNHLEHYAPNSELKKAYNLNFNKESLCNYNEIFHDYLKSKELTPSNITQVFETLLTIEDLTCMADYPPLAMNNVTPMHSEKRTFYLNLPDLKRNPQDIIIPYMDEVVLVPKASLLASTPSNDVFDTLLPHPHEQQNDKSLLRHIATVEQVTKQRVLFNFKSTDFPGLHIISEHYNVIVRPRRIPLRYQYRALQLLNEDKDIRNYLFPTKNPNKTPPVCANLNLINDTIATNLEQLQAVHHIVEGPNTYAPYVIFGPPGTGKTTTIVEAILQLRLQRPRSRILVTAGSNSACDTIALRICEYYNSSPQLKLHIAQQAKQPTIFTMDVRSDHQLIRIFSKSSFEKRGKTIDPLLLSHSNCSGGIYQHLGVNTVRQYGIIVATLCTVGMLVSSHVGKFHFFTHIFIDEAGASTEPETFVGIMGIKSTENCRLILSGDHKQLGPVLKSTRASELGLEQSLMERLLGRACYAVDGNGNYDHTLQTRLRRNYRSHPEIVRLYNELYYNNELIPAANKADVNLSANWHILPNAEFPIIFQAVHGLTAKSASSPSSFNCLEIQVLMWFVRRLLHDGIGGVPVAESDIGIITPYRAQCQRITQELNAHSFQGVDVGSVEAFQGREKHIIIVSLVRSFAGMGFVRNPRRLNVLLSRAKSLLILIGNPKTLSRNNDFNFLIKECVKQGTYMCKRKIKKRKSKILQADNPPVSPRSMQVGKGAELDECLIKKLPINATLPISAKTFLKNKYLSDNVSCIWQKTIQKQIQIQNDKSATQFPKLCDANNNSN